MKISKPKSSNNSNNHTSRPFFNKDGFTQSPKEEPPFFRPRNIQTKLTIGEPDDKYEQEADAMADKVVQKLDKPNSTSTIQNKGEDCTQEDKIQKKEEDEIKISKKPIFEGEENINNKLIQGKGISEVETSIENQLQNSKGGGQSLDKQTKQNMEQSFGADFTNVKVHTGSNAIQMNQSLGAQAFANGSDVYFNKGKYNPTTKEGNRLLAHELTHTIQQKTSNSIQTKPADLQVGSKKIPYNEDRIQISKVKDFEVLTASNATKYANNPQNLSATINDAKVKSLAWEVYDPSDVLAPDVNLQNNIIGPGIHHYPVLHSDAFVNNAREGRYTARCIGKDSTGDFIVYAEESFYVRLTEPLEQKNLSDLNQIKSNPGTHSLGEIGAAHGRSMMLEHKEAIKNTSVGTIGGNRSPQPAGTIEYDCTSYVLHVLEKAFIAKGIKNAWDKIFKNAAKNSNGPFLGTELLKSLVKVGGWKAIFWSPDPKNPDDNETEHPFAYNKTKTKSTYYGIPVESSKSIINYRKTSPESREDMTSYDNLKKVPLGVIAAKGGKHMTLIINGIVYEVHWDYLATNEDVIEATSLEEWGWNSGVVVIPSSDFKTSFP